VSQRQTAPSLQPSTSVLSSGNKATPLIIHDLQVSAVNLSKKNPLRLALPDFLFTRLRRAEIRKFASFLSLSRAGRDQMGGPNHKKDGSFLKKDLHPWQRRLIVTT